MRHLYIICGHGAGDSGAVGNGYTEAERVRALGRRIAELGGSNVTLLDTSRNWYADSGINSLNIPGDAGLVELHMDSGPASARGGHVIIKDGYAADEHDRKLADAMARIFPGRSSTIVGRSDLANVNRAARRGINYRLVENGFVSNAGDVATFNSRMDDVAKAYLDAFGIPVAGSQPKPYVHQTKRPTGSEPTVGAGEVYRLYNPNNGRHMLTMSQTERIALIREGWDDEGIAFEVVAGGDRVYRLYNPWTGEHLFTSSLKEAQALWDSEWEFEGVAFMSGGAIDVHRLFNRYTDDHLYTSNLDEVERAISAGWQHDGVAFKVAG